MDGLNGRNRVPDEMASCDAARRAWYFSVLAVSGQAEMMDDARISEVASIRDETREEEGGHRALFVAHYLENYFGWPAFSGVYLAPDGAPVALHAWNLLPDLAILDACADRFGEGHGVRVVRPDESDWRRFRKEWTAQHNPSLADRHPELLGTTWTGRDDQSRMAAAADLHGGAPWWLPDGADTGPYAAFRQTMASLRDDAVPEPVAAGFGPIPGRG